jgi:MraZ protein
VFIGTYKATLDAKGRLMVPAKIREALLSEYMPILIVSAYSNYLVAYPVEEWEKLSERIRELPQMQRDLSNFQRVLYSSACECPLDKQGRILIPANLRVHAGIEGNDVIILGVDTRVEIWNPDRWEERERTIRERMEDIADVLAEFGL